MKGLNTFEMKRVREEQSQWVDDFVTIVCFLEKHEMNSVARQGLDAVSGTTSSMSITQWLVQVKKGNVDDALRYIRLYNTPIEPPKELFDSASPSY